MPPSQRQGPGQAALDQALEAAKPCAECGACMAVCPVYALGQREELVARGKLRLIKALGRGELNPGPELAQALGRCLLCGRCAANCPSQTPTTQVLRLGRASLAQSLGLPLLERLGLGQLLPHPRRLDRAALLAGLAHPLLVALVPALSGLHLRLAGMELAQALPAPASPTFLQEAPPEVAGPRGAPRLGFFAGCLANYLRPQLARRALRLLSRVATVVIPPQGCCGLPAQGAGLDQLADELAARALDSFALAGVEGVVTACGSCAWSLSQALDRRAEQGEAPAWPAGVREISQVLAEHPGRFVAAGAAGLAVALHDPCHLKIGLKVHQEPRAMLQAAGVELAPLGQPDACCGGGGLFAVNQPELSRAIFAARAKDLAGSGATVLATSCSGCWLQWRSNLGPRARVVHPIQMLEPA